MTQYHLFTYDALNEHGFGFDAYRGTFTDLSAAYAAVTNDDMAELAITLEDGSLKRVAELVHTEHEIDADKIVITFWRFEDHDYEVARKRYTWSAYPNPQLENAPGRPAFLASGVYATGQWVESDPF